MKKLVLNLGLATLTVLPIVAVASCSATTPEAPSLTTEANKYKNPFTAKDTAKTMTSLAAIATIKGNNAEKLTALQNLVTLQLDNTNFTYTVEKASVGANDQTIDVTMKITEKASSAKSETVKVVINGFAQATSPLDIEAKRFQTSVEANSASKALTAASVIKKINEAATPEAKLTELQKLTTVPTPNTGFTIEVVSVQPGSTETSVAATIKVTQTSDGKTAEATFTVTGFSTTQSVIQAEAAKLENKAVLSDKATETAAQAGTAITAETLASYYAPVTLSDGFSYTWKSNEVIGDTVKVTVTVSSTDTSISSIEHSFIISGFKKVVDVEAARFNISLAARSQSIKTRRVITIFNELATTQENKLTALTEIVDNFPTPNTGFALSIGLASIVGDDANTSTSVTLALTISQTGTNNEAAATLTITGLTAETLQEQIQRLADTNLVTKPVLAGKQNETATQAKEAITDLDSLKSYYTLIPLPTGFQYNYSSAVVENENLKVTISISSTVANSGTTPVSKEVIITGFKTAALVALEAEAKSKLMNREAPEGKRTETAFQARAAITGDNALNAYYSNTPLASGYGYTFSKSEVDKTTPTTLNVTLRVRITSTNQAILHVVQITGFAPAKPIEKEALKFQTSTPAKTPATLTMGVISVINAIGENQTNKLTALKGYVANFPEVTEGYTLSIGQATPDAIIPTSVNIPITISQTPASSSRNAETPITVTFTITELTVGTKQQQLDTISKLFNNRAVLDAKKTETAAVAQKNLVSDPTLNSYYQNTTMPTEFTYSYAGVTEVNKQTSTTLNVTLRIAFKTDGPEMFKVVQISGFTALTEFEAEAQKFAISVPATTTSTSTSTNAVISGINGASGQPAKLTALKGFAALPSDADSYTIVINTAKIDPTMPTSVIVPMTISKPAANGATAPTPVSVNFIITDLTAPSASK